MIRVLAFHFPQFHPIPENDDLWGKGFTEWTNVTKAMPLFKGHYQPHLPGELGFYDLRLPEARDAQAQLAIEYGIHGFCYYHYWLNGRRLLERPVNEILRLGKPDFPFCLCWANENWTRKWDGAEDFVLVRQDYSVEDDIKHINYLCKNVFSDSRYITVNGKPLFLIYRSTKLPNPVRTVSIWREEAWKRYRMELYLCRVESFSEMLDPAEFGFDAAVEFHPEWYSLFPRVRDSKLWELIRKLGVAIKNRTGKLLYSESAEDLRSSLFENRALMNHFIFDYKNVVINNLTKKQTSYKRYPCVTPMWDNSPRRRTDAIIIRDSTPELYEKWLAKVVERFYPFSENENFIFINAWNEWAEGCHLEPCRKWGRAYLEATKKALSGHSAAASEQFTVSSGFKHDIIDFTSLERNSSHAKVAVQRINGSDYVGQEIIIGENDYIYFLGWVVEPNDKNCGGVFIEIGDKRFQAEYGLWRPDVAWEKGDAFLYSGFRLYASAAGIKKGKYNVNIIVVSRDLKSYFRCPSMKAIEIEIS